MVAQKPSALSLLPATCLCCWSPGCPSHTRRTMPAPAPFVHSTACRMKSSLSHLASSALCDPTPSNLPHLYLSPQGLFSVPSCSKICLWCFLDLTLVPHLLVLVGTLHFPKPLRKASRNLLQSLLKSPCLSSGWLLDWCPPVVWDPSSLVDLSTSLVTVLHLVIFTESAYWTQSGFRPS